MPAPDAKQTAGMMVRLHGLRAPAIALEKAAEMRRQGDLAGLHHWQRIHGAICELRQTAHANRFGEHQADHRS